MSFYLASLTHSDTGGFVSKMNIGSKFEPLTNFWIRNVLNNNLEVGTRKKVEEVKLGTLDDGEPHRESESISISIPPALPFLNLVFLVFRVLFPVSIRRFFPIP